MGNPFFMFFPPVASNPIRKFAKNEKINYAFQLKVRFYYYDNATCQRFIEVVSILLYIFDIFMLSYTIHDF